MPINQTKDMKTKKTIYLNKKPEGQYFVDVQKKIENGMRIKYIRYMTYKEWWENHSADMFADEDEFWNDMNEYNRNANNL